MSLPIAYLLSKPPIFRFSSSASYPVLFTHRVLLLCESISGRSMLSELLDDPPAHLLRDLLFSSISSVGFPGTVRDVGRRFTQSTLPRLHALIVNAWVESMPTEGQDEQLRKTLKMEAAVGAGTGNGKKESLSWMTAWASARNDFRLTDSEWLDMTPRQFRELRINQIEQYQREELLNGMVIATIENYSMNPPKTAAVPDSFMLHKYPEREPEPVTGESIMAQLQSRGWSRANKVLKEQMEASSRIPPPSSTPTP